MLPFERHRTIMETISGNGTVSIKELAARTGIPMTTLRRDIGALAEEGRLVKLHGAVSARRPGTGNRAGLHREEKTAIARATQEYIEDGDILLMSYGTTVSLVAELIDPAKKLTVITNGLDIVAALRDKPLLQVILLGGFVDYENNTLTGPTVPKMLDEFSPRKVIIGAGGITEERGITNYDFLSSAYYPDLLKGVDQIIVTADHSKFGRNVLTSVLSLDDVDILVTDDRIDPEHVELCRRYAVRLVRAPGK